MTATNQMWIVGIAVSVAVLYVLRSTWKTWFSNAAEKGCGAACGKCVAPTEPTQPGRYSLPQL